MLNWETFYYTVPVSIKQKTLFKRFHRFSTHTGLHHCFKCYTFFSHLHFILSLHIRYVLQFALFASNSVVSIATVFMVVLRTARFSYDDFSYVDWLYVCCVWYDFFSVDSIQLHANIFLTRYINNNNKLDIKTTRRKDPSILTA